MQEPAPAPVTCTNITEVRESNDCIKRSYPSTVRYEHEWWVFSLLIFIIIVIIFSSFWYPTYTYPIKENYDGRNYNKNLDNSNVSNNGRRSQTRRIPMENQGIYF